MSQTSLNRLPFPAARVGTALSGKMTGSTRLQTPHLAMHSVRPVIELVD
jgi:hypothetical protein